jgi:ABC-type uncharacterized transport system permease subunit
MNVLIGVICLCGALALWLSLRDALTRWRLMREAEVRLAEPGISLDEQIKRQADVWLFAGVIDGREYEQLVESGEDDHGTK